MVDAQVAGIFFTANPLTGKRRQAVIDATPGLGGALVSGLTNPDHFVVDTPTGMIVERRVGDKQVVIQSTGGGGTQRVEPAAQREAACLSETQVRALAALGDRVEAHFGSPQDIEWAIDRAGKIVLLQARPITTLFPLPPDAPITDAELRVYLSFNVQQGTARPFTPMGISALRLIASGIAAFVGYPSADPLLGPRFVIDAACRLFFDVTAALRTSFGRTLLTQMMEQAEVHAAAIFRQLTADPRLALVPMRRWLFARTIALFLVRSGMPWYLLQALLAPRAAQTRVQRLVHMVRTAGQGEPYIAAAEHLTTVERLLFHDTPRLLFKVSPVMLAGMQIYTLATRLLGDRATESECQMVLRGSPSNPTTAMNLALWALAQHVRKDTATARLVQDTPVVRLAADYHTGRLPPALQHGLATFLATYGHQAVAELDLGVPRWAEDPTYVLGLLAGYLPVRDPVQGPDVQVQRVAQAAEAMVHELTRRAAHTNWWRGLLASFCLRRARHLSGFREMPRFMLALLLAQARAHLAAIGAALTQAGRLEHAADIFFLTLPEMHAALAGTDMHSMVSERRANYAQERSRRHVPLVLLSDGTEPSVARHATASAQAMLQGTPASPGVVTAAARVIHDPDGAHLEPGEILVAPSTDPGWTPLFLTAAGLVMDMGGAMAHGAIVAREYGLPAVVGVAGATERISTGQIITVDGAAGTIVIEQSTDA
jgi:phosphohistidine swiveling domain-containing protein